MPFDDATIGKERILDEAASFMEGFYRGVSDGLDDARRILDNVDEQMSETLTIATKDL